MNNINTLRPGALDAFGKTRMIVPVAFTGIGTFACQILIYLNSLLEEIFGDLAADLPVGLRGLDSAAATKDLKVSLPGSPPRPPPPGLIMTYGDHTVSQLREQALRTKETRPLADKLGKLPAIEQLGDGCCQQPAAGLGLYAGNLQQARQSIVSTLLRTRDANRIAACRNAGLKVLQTKPIINVRFVNGAGSTGTGAEMVDAMMTKLEMSHHGLSVVTHQFVLLPSAGAAVNAQAARANAGKLLLESAMAAEHPGRISLSTLDGQTLRYTGAPLVDTITPIGVTSEFLAAATRQELAARLALLALTFITTPLLAASEEQFADSKAAQGDRRHGLPVFRRLGFARCFVHHQRNDEIARAAAAACLAERM